jgi:calpain-7
MSLHYSIKSMKAAEECIARSSSREEALQNAILATESYMKAIEQASSEVERDMLKTKCLRVLIRAEEIKKMKIWSLPISSNGERTGGRFSIVPSSLRTLSTREEVILLEGSKLHGFIFPPWQSDPGKETFDSTSNGELYTYLSLQILICILMS